MYVETDEDLDALLGERPAAAPALERIFSGVPAYSTTFELINRYSAQSPLHGIGFRDGQWFEVSEEIYWHFLEALPPLHMTSGGFVMSECTTDDLHECFFEIKGRYYCAVLAWSGPRSFAALWTALLAEVAQ